MTKRTRKVKSCSGCSEQFVTYKNYDYCSNCELNDSRYVPKIFLKQGNQVKRCPECGDGSGVIKFPNQTPRKCKICAMSKLNEKFWDQVNLLAQEKIYQILTSNIPLSNLKLITKAYQFTDKDNSLTGLFLGKDADYRTLLADIENQYSDEDLSTAEQLAEEIAVNYFYLVFKAILGDLSSCYGFDPSYFSLENLLN